MPFVPDQPSAGRFVPDQAPASPTAPKDGAVRLTGMNPVTALGETGLALGSSTLASAAEWDEVFAAFGGVR